MAALPNEGTAGGRIKFYNSPCSLQTLKSHEQKSSSAWRNRNSKLLFLKNFPNLIDIQETGLLWYTIFDSNPEDFQCSSLSFFL